MPENLPTWKRKIAMRKSMGSNPSRIINSIQQLLRTNFLKISKTIKQDDDKRRLRSNMSTRTHDELIEKTVDYAKSLGYDAVDKNTGTKTGADAVFQNHFGEQVILEVVTGSDFRKLFRKPRIEEALVRIGKYTTPLEYLGLIVVSHRINNVKKHAVEVGIPEELFRSKTQKIFAVRECQFNEIIPVLLVSILGSRASAYARVSP